MPSDATAPPAPPRAPANADRPGPGGGDPSLDPRWRALGAAALALVVAAGLVLRFWEVSDLWLDEALSVNIAGLPVADLLDALRRDGHPPFYYLLLHGWMELFGTSDVAVRALSGVIAVAALPVAWAVGRRYAGRRGAVVLVALLASSPYAARYATETRMYSLLVLLVLLGWLALRRAEERPTVGRLVPVAVAGGLLLLTHYWAFYLLGTLGAALLWRAWRAGEASDRRTALLLAAGVAASGLLFLPWLPAFLEQFGSTGTPWGTPGRPAAVFVYTLRDYSGGIGAESDLLGWVLGLLVLVAALGRPVGSAALRLELRVRRHVRPELVVVGGTLAVSIVVGFLTGSAFVTRYTAIVFPLVLLVAAYGVLQLPTRVLRVLVVGFLVVGNLGMGVRTSLRDRTQAGEVAAAIEEAAAPEDLVVYCPDQLGVGVSRLLPPAARGVTFPDLGDPRFVDWVDYEQRIAEADIESFAAEVDRLAGPDGAVFLVWFDGYRTHKEACPALIDALDRLRPSREALVESDEDVYEPARLVRYAPAG